MAIKRIPEIQGFLDYAREQDIATVALNILDDLADIANEQEASNEEEAEYLSALVEQLQWLKISLDDWLVDYAEEQE